MLLIMYSISSFNRKASVNKIIVLDGCAKAEKAVFYLCQYLLPSWKLESGDQTLARESTKMEMVALEQVLQEFCSVEEPKLKVSTTL